MLQTQIVSKGLELNTYAMGGKNASEWEMN